MTLDGYLVFVPLDGSDFNGIAPGEIRLADIEVCGGFSLSGCFHLLLVQCLGVLAGFDKIGNSDGGDQTQHGNDKENDDHCQRGHRKPA